MCDVNSNVGRQRDLPESRGKGQAWKREREGLMTRPHGRGRAPDVRVEDIRRESRRVHPRSRWRSLVCPPAGQRPPRRWHRPVPAGRGFPAGTAGLGRGCREEITLKKGLGPFPPPGNLPNPGIKCMSPACGTTRELRLEFPRETGLILKCPVKVGNPLQTKNLE